MAMENPVQFFKNLPKKKCPECGQTIKEQAESYFMECEHCLSKKAE
ncbi:protein YhfH [Pseudalkalibacillus sp. A8]